MIYLWSSTSSRRCWSSTKKTAAPASGMSGEKGKVDDIRAAGATRVRCTSSARRAPARPPGCTFGRAATTVLDSAAAAAAPADGGGGGLRRFNREDAVGFIRLLGLRLRSRSAPPAAAALPENTSSGRVVVVAVVAVVVCSADRAAMADRSSALDMLARSARRSARATSRSASRSGGGRVR